MLRAGAGGRARGLLGFDGRHRRRHRAGHAVADHGALPAASFGAFTPGVAKDYFASTSTKVISTAGDAALTASDAGANPGHLVNGTFSLPSAVQVKATNSANPASVYANVGSSAAPTPLLSYAAPVSNDEVTLDFKQSIAANDALRTGSYSKTLTFTLSTTTP